MMIKVIARFFFLVSTFLHTLFEIYPFVCFEVKMSLNGSKKKVSNIVRKKIDPRIRALIEANVSENHRSLFVIVGDKGREQIVNLHYMLSKATVKTRPSVLWCYKV